MLRGGWGIYYSHYSGNIPVTHRRRAVLRHHGEHQQHRQRPAAFTLANPFAIPGTPGTLALAGVAPHLLNSYAQQYTLSLERELTRNIGAARQLYRLQGNAVAYRRDVNQPLASTVAFNNARRPYPLFSNINYCR